MGHYSHMCHLPNPRQVPSNWLSNEYTRTKPQQIRFQPQQRQQQLKLTYPPTAPLKQNYPAFHASLFGTYTPLPPQVPQYPPSAPPPTLIPVPQVLPTQVNVLATQQQQLPPQQSQQQRMQLQLQQPQQTLAQQQQVLQSLAQIQIQKSLPTNQINATTTLFEDSDINQTS